MLQSLKIKEVNLSKGGFNFLFLNAFFHYGAFLKSLRMLANSIKNSSLRNKLVEMGCGNSTLGRIYCL